MEFPRPTITIEKEAFELLSLEEYKQRIGIPDLPTPTLLYKMNTTNELDYTTIGKTRYVIWNQKAQNLTLAKRRPRK